jgi:hypothetical protein
MSNERIQILTMLKEGKISVEEAEQLLIATGKKAEPAEPEEQLGDRPKKKTSMKYLRITEERKRTEEGDLEKHLDIRIPLVLLRAGAKLQTILPENTKEKIDGKLKDKLGGVGLEFLETQNMDALADALGEEGISIEIEKPNKTIRVYCE